MIISIDAYNLALEHGTGVATYGRNLVTSAGALGHNIGVLYGSPFGHSKVALLNEIGLIDGPSIAKKKGGGVKAGMGSLSAPLTLFGTRQAKEVPLSGQVIVPPHKRLAAHRYWNIRDLYRNALGLYRATGAATNVRVDGLDLAHWTYPLPVEARGARNVYTLHDLVPLRLPYTTADRKRVYYRLCKRIAERADHIITVSECARHDIIQLLGVTEDRITNTYQSSDIAQLLNGVDEAAVETYVTGTLGVDLYGYFLFFGAIEPKKNVARLLEAYLGSSSRTPLVIVGAPGWGGDKEARLLKSISSLDAKKRIVWLDYLPREMLAMLIAGARATLFPSLYEGFGLPVLESMLLGTPVVTSNTSSLPEVAGDAAILVDPYDVRSIAGAIRTIDNDADIRKELRAKGRVQADRFSRARYEDRLKSLYERLG